MSQGPRLVHSMDVLPFMGGRLCLDFVNTANWLDGQPVDDRLSAPQELAIWSYRQGLLAEARLTGEIGEAQRLRLLLRHCFVPKDADGAPDLSALDAFRAAPATLQRGSDGRPHLAEASVTAVLSLVAQSAGELLLTDALTQLKVCPGERCGWLFLDDSPTGRRRWCSMAVCGNRAKAKRHYRQQSKD